MLQYQYHQASDANKSSIPGHGYFAKLELFENNHCENGKLYIEYRKNACKEKSGELCDFCKENEVISSVTQTSTTTISRARVPKLP